jgi:hypothetical protein
MHDKHVSTSKSNLEPSVNNSVSTDVTEYLNEDRRRMVAEAAYFLALQHAFQGGNIEDDWYRAEAEIDATLTTAKTYRLAEYSVNAIKNS